MNDFFNTVEFVEQYYEMVKEYGSSFITSKFKNFIPKKSKVLELGFGTGVDYFALCKDYRVTPSDYSQAFIDEFKKRYAISVVQVDAKKIELNEKFDCIFSNKVLHVLTDEELKQSLQSQFETLSEEGFIFHTLWYEKDSKSDEYANRVNEDKVKEYLGSKFDIIHMERYDEIEEQDSLIVIAQKSKN